MAAKTPYVGGMPAVLARYEDRRDPLDFAEGESLPPLDTDLNALARQTVGAPAQDPAEAPPFRSAHHRKRFDLRQQFTGLSELSCLCALTIAHLRKRSYPEHAPALFRRLWREAAPHLLEQLDPRWQVSAITTFADHGDTQEQRAVGQGLSTLFAVMKLHESERLFSGLSPQTPFRLGNRIKAPLPLQMDAYALENGGLDVNLLARLWQEAEVDPVIRPLAQGLIDQVIRDPGTVFARLAQLREDRIEKKAQQTSQTAAPARAEALPRWGLVTTIKTDPETAQRFAAWHLERGASHLYLCLDEPNTALSEALSGHPAITLVPAGPEDWRTVPGHKAAGKWGNRPQKHQPRQTANATRLLHHVQDLDWLAHIDVDEFLLPTQSSGSALAESLGAMPSEAICARIRPIEAMQAPHDTAPETVWFKALPRAARDRGPAAEDCFPTWGRHLPGGFLSHLSGKLFVRLAKAKSISQVEFRLHNLRNGAGQNLPSPDLPDCELGHFHAPNWESFLKHYRFRLERGSYRAELKPPARQKDSPTLHALLQMIEAEGGEDALRLFYQEVACATPDLRARLSRHRLLRQHTMDFETLKAAHFPVK